MNKPVVAHSVNPYMFLTGTWIYNQIINLKEFEPIVLTTFTINRDIFPFDKIYTTETQPTWQQVVEKAFRKIFKTYLPYWVKCCKLEKARILHSHFGSQGWQNLGLAKKLNIPHVVSFYSVDIIRETKHHPRMKENYRKMFDRVAGVFVEGPYAKKMMVNIGCPEEKVHISHLGVDLASINRLKGYGKMEHHLKF